ncbi:MAG: hypothetical protein ACE5IF_02460 [Candidatus Bathyarchaeia archaeon]
MADWISYDEDLSKHEKREKLDLRAQKLFGIIKDIYRKIHRSKPATILPAHETIKALKDYQIEFEQRKSEALAHLYQYARAHT